MGNVGFIQGQKKGQKCRRDANRNYENIEGKEDRDIISIPVRNDWSNRRRIDVDSTSMRR